MSGLISIIIVVVVIIIMHHSNTFTISLLPGSKDDKARYRYVDRKCISKQRNEMEWKRAFLVLNHTQCNVVRRVYNSKC